ncbi:hypothetical protein ACFWU5_04830 [Nocardia sp. NPDC058640]|uniref:hypothetical protein n=1 Tax=Nocardia sp. NPDC058640 TaxID=3346571 RepID=UPI00365B031E
MKFGKISTAVFMAVAAVGITAGTAHGAPAVAIEQPAAALAGVTVSPVDKAITWTVDSGKFEIAADGAAVLLKGADGATVDQVSLRQEIAGLPIAVTPEISQDGRAVKLAASMAPADSVKLHDVAELKDISAYDRFMYQTQKNMPGIIVGGVIGLFFPFLWFVTIPAGMFIGGYVMGGEEFREAVVAYLTGQP